MKTQRVWKLLSLAFLIPALFACGMNDGGGGIGGTGAEVTSVGPITGFGSVIVNGVEFRIDPVTQFEVEGLENAREDDLGIGMVVEVQGKLDEDRLGGVATRIHFEDNLEGPITAKDDAAGTITVLGQTVFADEANFAGATFAALAGGDVVEVSGLVDADGAIRATRIEKKVADSVVELKGVVSGLSSETKSFLIGTQRVLYSAAPRNGTLQDGVRVEVTGTLQAVGGDLLASDVEVKLPSLAGIANREAELEGIITEFLSLASFKVNGHPVDASAAREFEGGTGTDLRNNVKVEVEGLIDASGVLVAEKVQIRRPRNIRIEANAQAKTADSVVLMGITVLVDSQTRFEDERSNSQSLRLADVVAGQGNAGDRLAVRGFEDNLGNVVASRIERRDDPSDAELLRGTAFSPNPAAGTVMILGVTVATTPQTRFEDLSDERMFTAGEFFNSLEGGVTVVKARGDFAAGVLTADELSLERPSTGYRKGGRD